MKYHPELNLHIQQAGPHLNFRATYNYSHAQTLWSSLQLTELAMLDPSNDIRKT